jgi:hypothetical protein
MVFPETLFNSSPSFPNPTTLMLTGAFWPFHNGIKVDTVWDSIDSHWQVKGIMVYRLIQKTWQSK